MIKYILPFFLVGIVSLEATAQRFNAQEGYIVTQAGDTIRGLIKDRVDLSEQLLFQPRGGSDYKEYTPEEVAAFQYEGDYYYKAMPVPNEDKTVTTKFLLCLLQGEIGLYEGPDYLYVEKPANTLYRLEEETVQTKATQVRDRKKYMGTLSYLMADCPAVQEVIARTKLNPPGLIKLVTRYNECVNPAQQTKRTTEPAKIDVRWGIKSGVSFNNIDYYTIGNTGGIFIRDYDFVGKRSYVGGAMLELSYKNKFAVRSELLINQRGGSYDRPVNSIRIEQLDFSLTTLQAPLSVYYTLPTHRLRPFILGGGTLSYTVAENSYRRLLNAETRAPVETDVVISTYRRQVGYHAGAGLSYTLNSGGQLGIEYVYERALTHGKESPVLELHFITHRLAITYLLPFKRK